jgi:hypothetical protein
MLTRSYDADGRLHLDSIIISKAQVSPYHGFEIPSADELGLDPSRIYRLLRPAAELMKAAPSLIGVPVLSQHIPVDPNNHEPTAVVGAVMGDCRFSDPYLLASACIWTAEAISGIERGTKSGVSAGYSYTVIMENCASWDGVMTDLAFNHIAIVDNPRVPDAVIGDAAPQWLAEEMSFRNFRRAIGLPLEDRKWNFKRRFVGAA